MASSNVVVQVGSLRKELLCRRIAQALIALNSTPLKFEFAEIGNLPLYNQDLEGESPLATSISFFSQIKSADAVLFVTPEYNRSVAGGLENALHVGSRHRGKNVWDGEPGAVISVSPGALGAFGANHHLRQSLVPLNVPTMQQPEAYIGGAANLFGAEGRLTNEGTRDFLLKFVKSFAAWIEANRQQQSSPASG